MKNTKILLVDDDPDQLNIMKGYLENQGYGVFTCENGKDAVTAFKNNSFSIVVTDLRMPEMTGDKLIFEINRINPMVKKIMITAFADVKTAVEVMKSGADDFIEKPVDLKDFLKKIKKLELEYFRDEESSKLEDRINLDNLPLKIIGKSESLKEALLRGGRVAAKDWTVLLNGETGTGKELFARLIHLLSPRKDMPFIEVNCASIPENLFESELFGHKKGAFTGADQDKKGMVEMAAKGTLFLDEIGEIPLSMQVKLLRTIQEREIQRVGSDKAIHVNVRIIVATNRSLEEEVKKGRFREDLFYRLNVINITVPPLRDRTDDVPLLAQRFLNKYTKENNKRIKGLTPMAMDALTKYNWPGNVRELENVIERAIILCMGQYLSEKDLPPNILKDYEPKNSIQSQLSGGSKSLDDIEKIALIETLKQTKGNKTEAAKILNITRTTLRNKLKKHNLDLEKILPVVPSQVDG
jgi:two-component system response regulator HydG